MEPNAQNYVRPFAAVLMHSGQHQRLHWHTSQKESKMNETQREFLSAQNEAASKIQPEFAILRSKLLEHGGEELVPPCAWDNNLQQNTVRRETDVAALIDHGYLMNSVDVICKSRGMEPNSCHRNISRLWLQKKKRDPLAGIATGYCLTEDGLWLQHSWGVRKGKDARIVETLGKRDMYFGILLTGIDADVFAFQRLAQDRRNGPLFTETIVERV
jgi:hypothetical protein